MYQLIKSTSFGGISVEESLSLSFLQEKMRKDFQEITKMKSVSASELSDKAAFIPAGAECYHWLIREECCKVAVRGGFLEASEINDPDYPGISVDFPELMVTSCHLLLSSRRKIILELLCIQKCTRKNQSTMSHSNMTAK